MQCSPGKAYRVWAPEARDVSVRAGASEHGMYPEARGWWRSDRTAVEGEDYAFLVDGDGPFPDPRSAWQPAGVHGRSRVVGHAAFRWTDTHWQAPPLAAGIVYELHVGTFTPEGTFDAVVSRLPYLRDLGITHVELMPVNQFSGRYGWGYDGVGLYAPHDAYGSPDDLKRLVDACHRHGLAVLLDVVYNHLGPAGNYLGKFGPYFTHRYRTPWGPAVNLDGAGSDEVRRFFVEDSLMWLRDYHFDGLRLDAVHAIIDTSATHFLEELARAVRGLERELGRHLTLVAESDLNDPRIIRPFEAGGYGLDAQWSDDFHHALHTLFTGERSGYYADFGSMAQLAKALRDGYVYDGAYSEYRGRRHGRPAAGAGGERFCVCIQNHDQVGNRACGERLSMLTSPGRLKIAAALLLTSPFIPLLFQGEEWGATTPFQYFTDHEDPELGAAVSKGRRREFEAFGWQPDEVPDPQDRATFERSKLDWSERDREPGVRMLAWYRELIELRRRTPELGAGPRQEVTAEFSEAAGWFRVRRGNITLLFNIGKSPWIQPLEQGAAVLLSSDGVIGKASAIEIPPDSVALVREPVDYPREHTEPGRPAEMYTALSGLG